LFCPTGLARLAAQQVRGFRILIFRKPDQSDRENYNSVD
jgi:hypothetical protein